jgi:hypothetical protein
MSRSRFFAVVTFLFLAISLLGANMLVQAAPATPQAFRFRPTSTPRRTPTPLPPTPTATPPPQPVCWSLVPGPNLVAVRSELRDIAGSAANDLWAVGTYTDDNYARHTLALHWNGSVWQVIPTPDVVATGSSISNVLNSVTVVSSNDVWAVGYGVSTSVAYMTITLHWNGSSWKVIPSPNLTTQGSYNALNGVVAIASNDVWAVGGVPKIELSSVNGNSILMHWDGAAWTLFPEPPEAANYYDKARTAVAALSSNDVWAAGKTGAWHWDGVAWHAPSGFAGQFQDGIGTNGVDLWSAGTNPPMTGEGSSPSIPNAQWFNGTTWQSTIPVTSGKAAGFYAVKVFAANNVWAVGFNGLYALSERWDGAKWNVVTAANGNPNPSPYRSTGNVLQGISALSPTNIWAVGYYYDSSGSYGEQHLLIERNTCG